jgi:arginine decarboxylase
MSIMLQRELDELGAIENRLRTIEIASTVGTGPTKLAAFDDALIRCGVGNFNLIRLSSVIPPATEVVTTKGPLDVLGNWGDRLFVVMAEQRVDRVGREAWAGIGWVQHEETGRGLFVEHEGISEHQVRDDIEHSLAALMQARPHVSFGEPKSVVAGGRCFGEPICAMAVAVYESASWSIDLLGQ